MENLSPAPHIGKAFRQKLANGLIIAGLIIIAIIATGHHLLIVRQLEMTRASEYVAETTQQQRTLILETALLAQELTNPANKTNLAKTRKELLLAIERLENIHQRLLKGNPARGYKPSTQVYQIYYSPPWSLHSQLEAYNTQLRSLAQTPSESLHPEMIQMDYIRSTLQEKDLLNALTQVVNTYEAKRNTRTDQTNVLSILSLLSTLLVLMTTAFLTLRPLRNKLSDSNSLAQLGQESIKQFELLANTAPMFVWIANEQGSHTYCNHQWLQYTGRPFEQETGNGWQENIHPDDLACVLETAQQARQNMQPFQVEYRLKNALGDYHWLQHHGIPRFTENGQFIGHVGTCTDIHERKKHEDLLNQSEEFAFSTLNSLPTGIAILDNQGNIITYNKTWQELLYQSELTDPISQSFFNLLKNKMMLPEDAEDAVIGIKQVIDGESPLYTQEYSANIQGNIRWFTLRASSFIGSDPAKVVISEEDITPRKETEEKLKELANKLLQSNRELQDFALVASHDLQEPLRKIIAFNERLQAALDKRVDQKSQQYLERINHSVLRMKALIDDLLIYSRVTTKAKPFSSIDLNKVVKEVLTDLEMKVEEHQAIIHVEPLPTIEADPLQMRQLFQNLLSNALKFNQTGIPPEIKIYCEQPDILTDAHSELKRLPDNKCRFIVEDNGIGFDEKYIDRIFTMFQRLHSQNDYQGTGIGLSICRKIVERHGGTITATSSPGHGSKFIFELPITQTLGDHSAHDTTKQPDYAITGR